MNALMTEFKKIAPFIVDAVKARVAAGMTDEEVMVIVHEEILAYFEKQKLMSVQHILFSAEQRATFSGIMYDLLKPLAAEFAARSNPLYDEYVAKTGKTGALNYITKA